MPDNISVYIYPRKKSRATGETWRTVRVYLIGRRNRPIKFLLGWNGKRLADSTYLKRMLKNYRNELDELKDYLKSVEF